MAPARKRQRREESPNEEDAYCPFRTVQATAWSTNTKSKKKQKRRKVDSDSVEPDEGEDGEGNRQLLQLSPFTPSMGLEGYPTLDMHYAIEPYKEWVEMTRYNSFVLNSTKYFCEGFVYVANENTVQRERNEAGAEGGGPKLRIKKKSDDDWVARILEIRAKDEHHVYARVYWMYWPDELIEGTMYRGKPIKGRQPFHGTNELIASNHMDIINVISVTGKATVNQWFEDNHDDVQESLYWRQAFDVRTMELSPVELTCKCKTPANPDKTLLCCPECSTWLHIECIRDDVLSEVYSQLGKDKPYRLPVKTEDDIEGQRPLSPQDGNVVSTQAIDVKAESPTKPRAENESEEPPSQSQRSRKKKSDTKPPAKPWEGLFDAAVLLNCSPQVVQVSDLRPSIEGGEKTWTMPIKCLVCQTKID